MDLIREVQQYLADEADAQRFVWEGREYLNINDPKLVELWRGFGALPDTEEGAVEGVKMHGFRDSIPLEHQAEWDAYLKKHPGALAGKAQGRSVTLDTSGWSCISDDDGNVSVQHGTGFAQLRIDDIPKFIAFLQSVTNETPVHVPTTRHPSPGPQHGPAPATSFSNPPNWSNRPRMGPNGPYQSSGPGPQNEYAPPANLPAKAIVSNPAALSLQARRNVESLEYAVKQERKYNTTARNWKQTAPELPRE
jgi:hypothetical protein